MAITVDWATSVVNVPISYLTLIGGSVYDLDVEQFRKDLRNLEDDVDGRAWSRTHDYDPVTLLSGVNYAGKVNMLTPYTVEFEDGQYAVSCSGANHNITDVKVVNQVSLVINNSAGLQIVVSGSGVTEQDKDDIATKVWDHIKALPFGKWFGLK